MQDKQKVTKKVTFYLSSGVHRKLKIQASIDDESMSAIVERALNFYMKYPEQVEAIEGAAYGKAYQVHVCPECETALVMKNDRMVSLKRQPGIVSEEFPIEVGERETGEAELVPC